MPNNNAEKISCSTCRVILPKHKRYTAYALIGIFVAFFVGLYVGSMLFYTDPLEKEMEIITLKKISVSPTVGDIDLKDLKDSEEVYNYKGIIDSIQGNTLSFRYGTEDEKIKVMVTGDTIIEGFIDNTKPRKISVSGSGPPPLQEPPTNPTILKTFSLKDLQSGTFVQITTSVDISNADSVDAIKVVLHSNAAKGTGEVLPETD